MGHWLLQYPQRVYDEKRRHCCYLDPLMLEGKMMQETLRAARMHVAPRFQILTE